MAKVLCIHQFMLRPGVAEEDFERFIKEEWPSAPTLAGTTSHCLKGDRGDREGRYIMIFEYDSKETRDRLSPSVTEENEEFQAWRQATAPWFEKVSKLVTESIWTDYVVLE